MGPPFIVIAVAAGLALAGCTSGSDRRPDAEVIAEDAGPGGDAVIVDADAAALDAGRSDVGELDGGAPVLPDTVRVRITLDGVPVEGARASYGGSGEFVETSSAGLATVSLQPRIPGFEQVVIAAHPEARTEAGLVLPGHEGVLEIPMMRFDPRDNPAYRFADPGEPDRRDTTAQCAHCHVRMNEAWSTSAHRGSAKNPTVTDLYTGAASHLQTEASCRAAGGAWARGREPGSLEPIDRCFVGRGLLQAVNPSCTTPSCDDGTEVGECAACHAPGIDGELIGRGLLEAQGRAFEFGVHCDVCHRVEEVVAPSAGPGVAGALRVLRPSETGPIGLGEDGWLPLTFGPSWDSPNPKMGSVPRPHFREPSLCAGCHQYDQPALVPGTSLDPGRWPSGELPVQSTFEEWSAGPYAPGVPCQACHMPPDSEAENGADLQLIGDGSQGVAGGWPRPPGEVRSHAFVGPKTVGAGLLQIAAALDLTVRRQGGELTAEVTTTNVGAGHALPTGEPSRQVFLHVEARCGTSTLAAIGGDAIGALGGYADRRAGSEDLSRWPGASVGDVLRAVAIGDFEDYDGVGPFGRAGRFGPQAKGRRRVEALAEARVVGVDADRVTLDRPLPAADEVFRISAPRSADPEALAGRPGTSFARVLVGPQGDLAVPHFAAVDVLRDDRLLPRGSRRTEHVFAVPAACDRAPEVTARLIYRPFPRALTLERGWRRGDVVMTEASR